MFVQLWYANSLFSAWIHELSGIQGGLTAEVVIAAIVAVFLFLSSVLTGLVAAAITRAVGWVVIGFIK